MSSDSGLSTLEKLEQIEKLLAEVKIEFKKDSQAKEAEKSECVSTVNTHTNKEDEEETTVSLGVFDSNGREIHYRDEVEFYPTGTTKGGTGLAHSLTRGKDPFLRIKPIFHKSKGNIYTHLEPIKRKPSNVKIVGTSCRTMVV